jgi:deazaflavin-dependent oxidoreductase (nitroreductase family)
MAKRRFDKRRLTSALGRYVLNPPVHALFRLGIPVPGTAILETVGRKTGARRRTPVTNGLDDGTFWIVAEHGRSAGYVRNIEAHPRVRLKLGHRWLSGSAWILDEDDPVERLRLMRRRRSARFNASVVASMGTELLVLRVDLDR